MFSPPLLRRCFHPAHHNSTLSVFWPDLKALITRDFPWGARSFPAPHVGVFFGPPTLFWRVAALRFALVRRLPFSSPFWPTSNVQSLRHFETASPFWPPVAASFFQDLLLAFYPWFFFSLKRPHASPGPGDTLDHSPFEFYSLIFLEFPLRLRLCHQNSFTPPPPPFDSTKSPSPPLGERLSLSPFLQRKLSRVFLD